MCSWGSFRLYFSVTSGEWGSPLSLPVLPSMLRGALSISRRFPAGSPCCRHSFSPLPLAPFGCSVQDRAHGRSLHCHRHPLPPARRAPAGTVVLQLLPNDQCFVVLFPLKYFFCFCFYFYCFSAPASYLFSQTLEPVKAVDVQAAAQPGDLTFLPLLLCALSLTRWQCW